MAGSSKTNFLQMVMAGSIKMATSSAKHMNSTTQVTGLQPWRSEHQDFLMLLQKGQQRCCLMQHMQRLEHTHSLERLMSHAKNGSPCNGLLLCELLACCCYVALEQQLTGSDPLTAGGKGSQLLPHFVLQARSIADSLVKQ
jgi:hypothetical protein